MKSYCYTFIGILMAVSLGQTLAEKVMRPKFNKIQLWSNETFLRHNITFEPNDPHINLTLKLLQELHKVDVHIEATVTQKLNRNYYLNLNTSLNLCTILNYGSKSPLGALALVFLQKYGHIFAKCPIVKGLYYMHNFWLPEDPTLSALCEVDFNINFLAYQVNADQQRTLIINDHLSGEMVIQNVTSVKRGILAFLPLVPGG